MSMVNRRNEKIGGAFVLSRIISCLPEVAAVLLFALSLSLVPPAMAEETAVTSEAGSESVAENSAGYEKVIALLQEQDKKNSREFRQLKREIAVLGQQLENPGIAEIVGGIGYIFGLFGVAAYVMSRKKNISGER
jgi:nickel transport protein